LQVVDNDGRPPDLRAVYEGNLDIAGIVRRSNELPGYVAVAPVRGVHIADGLPILDELVQGGFGQVDVIAIVAAPGVAVVAAIGDDHVKGCAVVGVGDP